MLFAQLTGLETREFWIGSYVVLGLCSIGMLAWLIVRLRCPDCGRLLWLQYLHIPLDEKQMTDRLKSCPSCHVDFESEMEAR